MEEGRALVPGAVAEPAMASLHAFAPIGTLSIASINDGPAAASRPWDRRREGFVPAHGGAAVVLESLAHARRRGARPLAEVLGVEPGSDACHRPPRPSPVDQAVLLRGLLERVDVRPEDLDLVSAHAASTPAGDLAEAQALAPALGEHATKIPVNAVKSMLGHRGWSASLIEVVVAVAQMLRGQVHGTADLQRPDLRIDLALSSGGRRPVRTVLNNAFGFGGRSCVSLLRSME